MWREWNELNRMFKAMDALHSRMNTMFAGQDDYRYLGTVAGIPQLGPRTNLYDAGDYLVLKAEVPAIKKEDLTVKLQGNYLEIRGERKEKPPEGYVRHRVERGTMSFSRSFTLPADVDSSKVEATMKDGILALKMPKLEAAKPRQITIN
jgi:HSP20 family protein